MLYAIAHFLRDKCPFIWDMIDIVNAWLFSMRYGKKLKAIESGILEQYAKECCMKVVPMCEVPTEQLVAFFAAQPGRLIHSSNLMDSMGRASRSCSGIARSWLIF